MHFHVITRHQRDNPILSKWPKWSKFLIAGKTGNSKPCLTSWVTHVMISYWNMHPYHASGLKVLHCSMNRRENYRIEDEPVLASFLILSKKLPLDTQWTVLSNSDYEIIMIDQIYSNSRLLNSIFIETYHMSHIIWVICDGAYFECLKETIWFVRLVFAAFGHFEQC